MESTNRTFTGFANFFREIIPKHVPANSDIFKLIEAIEGQFNDIYAVTSGHVKNVSDTEQCDVRFLPIIARSIGVTNFDTCGFESLDITGTVQSDLLKMFNYYTTAVSEQSVTTATNVTVSGSSGYDYSSSIVADMINNGDLVLEAEAIVPTSAAYTIGCETDVVSDGVKTIYELITSYIVDGGDDLTDDGVIAAQILGLEFPVASTGGEKYAIFEDRLVYIINKTKWHRKFLMLTVIRMQNKGSKRAIELLFRDYILREMTDYGNNNVGISAVQGAYNFYGRGQTQDVVNNGFDVEVVDLADPWNYFSGDEAAFLNPIVEEPGLNDVYNRYRSKHEMPEYADSDLAWQKTIKDLIIPFVDPYAGSDTGFVVTGSPFDEAVVDGQYTGHPSYPYPVDRYQNGYGTASHMWTSAYADADIGVSGTPSLDGRHGVEIATIGNDTISTTKGYHRYRSVGVDKVSWDAMPEPSYEEAIKLGIEGIYANYSDFVSNTRGTAATLQNALDQFEVDDTYHYFTFNNQGVLKYLFDEEVSGSDDIYNDFQERIPYLTNEEATGENHICPTPRNGEWGSTAASAYQHHPIKQFDSDAFGNKYILTCNLFNVTGDGIVASGTESGYFNTPSSGVLLMKNEEAGSNIGIWVLPAITYGGNNLQGMISDVAVVSDSLMITTFNKQVYFYKLGSNGPISGGAQSTGAREFVCGRVDNESNGYTFVTKLGNQYQYQLYRPENHVWATLCSNTVTGSVVACDVFPSTYPGFALVTGPSPNYYVSRCSQKYGNAVEDLPAWITPAVVGFVGLVVNQVNGDGILMFNVADNDTLYSGLDDYTTAILLKKLVTAPTMDYANESEYDFTYKYYQYNGVGINGAGSVEKEQSFKSQRLKVIDFTINDELLALIMAPVPKLVDTFSGDGVTPMPIDTFAYWDDANNMGMSGTTSGGYTFTDLDNGTTNHYFNLACFINLGSDVDYLTNEIKYNATSLKNMFTFTNDTSYYLPESMVSGGLVNTRRYYRAKLYDSLYFILYDTNASFKHPLVERVAKWYFYNEKARKSGLFDIKIKNFGFSSELSGDSVDPLPGTEKYEMKRHIEATIKEMVEYVKPATSVLRNIVWVNPTESIPPTSSGACLL
jgi:hypothetical protein